MSAFERSLRGAPSPSPASTGSSSLKPAEARKKKSVRWNVSESDIPHDLCDSASGGVLRASNGPNSGLGSIPEQSIDHLRVPSTRPASNASRIEVTRNFDNHGPTGATAATASSSRKRTGERGIQAGAVRVRTPAKPKRPRAADGTPAGVLATMSSSGNHDNAARGGRPTPHSYLRRSGLATSATSSPKQSPARRSRSAQDAPTPAPPAARVSSRSPTIPSPPRPRFATAANAGSSSTPAPACTPAAAAARARAKASPRRRISSSQALRSVAGGDTEHAGAFGDDNDFDEAGMEGEEEEEPVVNGVSPMSLLSNTLSSIDIIGSAGRPPRSPTKACRSPRAGWSPRAGAGVGAAAAAARSSPRGGGESPRARGLSIAAGQRRAERSGPAATSNGLGRGFFSSGSSLPQEPEEEEGEGGEEQEDVIDELAPSVMRQSLETRLAAASSSLAASSRKASPDTVRSTTNTTTTTSPKGSPFRTVVRRRSTSLVHVNGESSFVSEEVSEESSFSVNSSCSCQHDPGLGGTTGAMVEHEQQQLVVQEDGGERENGSSIEVRNRLDELQERNSALEQEKVNLTMALVPLEERLESKEKAWESERRELVIRTEESSRAAKTAEERAREVEKRKVEMEEERHTLDAEVRRLRGEIEQRESKTAESFWQRTVAADREKTRLETALDQAQAKVVTLSNEKSELEAELLPIQSEAASFKVRFTEAEKVASRVLRAEEALRFSEVQLEVMKTEFGATSAQLMAMQTELAQQKAGARKQLEEKERKAGDAVASMRREMERLKEAICIQADRVVEAASKSKQASAEGGDRQLVLASPDPSAALMSSEATRIRQQELTNLRTELDIERERGLHRQRLLEEGEDERRRMHNIIQELRGSVRVFVRARPFLKSDGEDAAEQGAGVVCCGSDSCSVAVVPPDNPNRAISCAFDHVFGGHASQEDVFKEVSGFVQSALDGFKVCLFSYGQTGSGKTHTMAGSGTGMMRGIVPRAVEHILARVGELQDGPWSYSVQASFLEIYNEELRDLLVGHGDSESGASANTRSANGTGASPQKLSIKLAAGGGTEVVGLTKFPIDTSDRQQGLGELDEIMSVAQRARSVASTAMNAQSSRSHSVFTLWLTGVDASTGTTLKGVLHLVDLAGSERLDRSGVGSDAQRLKETQNINKSLSCLADVFSALSAKASHIPFRNSKLTYLMQDCLSGEGKALMFVNVSPTAPSASETVCSLRFANQVSQVQLGKATRQMSLSKPTGSRGGGRPPSSGNSPTRSQVNRPTRASGSGASSASTAPPSPRTSAGGTTRGSGSFGFGRASVGGRRTSTSANGPASPSRTRRAAAAAGGGSGVAGRARLSSSSVTGPPSPRTLGRGGGRMGASGRPSFSGAGNAAQSRGSVSGAGTAPSRGSVRGTGGGASGKFGGRASVSGAGRKSMSTRGVRGSEGARAKSVSGAAAVAEAAAVVAAEAAAARKAKKAPEERTSFSGSTRPSSAISRINEGMPPSPNPHAAVDKRPRLSVDEEGMMSL